MLYPPAKIAIIVSDLLGVSLEKMRGRDHKDRIVYARRLYACAAQDEGHSYPDITRGMRRVRHSTGFGWCQNAPITEEFERDLERVHCAIDGFRKGL